MSQIEKTRNIFNQTLLMFENHFRFKVDYTPESLATIETTLDVMYPRGTMAHNSTLVSLGYYVGEVFIRNIPGAQWDEGLCKGNPFCVTFQLQNDKMLMACPPEMVHDYIMHPGNSISRLFTYFKEVSHGTRELEDKLAGVSYTMIN